jgi:hypothetical protein
MKGRNGGTHVYIQEECVAVGTSALTRGLLGGLAGLAALSHVSGLVGGGLLLIDLHRKTSSRSETDVCRKQAKNNCYKNVNQHAQPSTHLLLCGVQAVPLLADGLDDVLLGEFWLLTLQNVTVIRGEMHVRSQGLLGLRGLQNIEDINTWLLEHVRGRKSLKIR